MGTDSIVGYNSVMNFAEQYLDRYLDPVTQAFTPAVAKSILELKPDGEVAARVQELGQKSNDGTMTDAERDEYKSLADMGTFESKGSPLS